MFGFHGVLPRIKDGTYVINLVGKQSKGTRLVSLFIDKDTAVFLGSFKIEYIPKEVLRKTKTNESNITQSQDYIMYEF